MEDFIVTLSQDRLNNRSAVGHHSVPYVAGESHHHKLNEWHVRVHAIHVIFAVNEHVEVVLCALQTAVH